MSKVKTKGRQYQYGKRKKAWGKDLKSLDRRMDKLELKPEVKFSIIHRPLAGFAITGFDYFLLNGTTRGTNINQRAGFQTYGKSVEINMIFRNISLFVTNTVRIIAFRFIDANIQAAPPIASFLQRTVTPFDQLNSFYNPIDKKLYKIYKDRTIVLAAANINTANAGSNSSGDDVVYVKWRLNLHGMKTDFNVGNAGTAADIITNAVYLLVLQDSFNLEGQIERAYYFTDT